MNKALLATALIALAGLHIAAAQSLLPNATFDSNVDGWTVESVGGGFVEWEPVLGLPPGAIRLSGSDQEALPDICFSVVPGTYRFRVDAYGDTAIGGAVICSINFAMYESYGCPGNHSFLVGDIPGTWTIEERQWVQLGYDLVNVHEFGGVKSIRPILNKQVLDPANDCVFDNVHFELIPALAPPPIPTASSVGLGVLAALLAVASFVVLRRRG